MQIIIEALFQSSNQEISHMKRATLVGSVTAFSVLVLLLLCSRPSLLRPAR